MEMSCGPGRSCCNELRPAKKELRAGSEQLKKWEKLNGLNGLPEHGGDGNTTVTWPDGETKVSGAAVEAREIADRWSWTETKSRGYLDGPSWPTLLLNGSMLQSPRFEAVWAMQETIGRSTSHCANTTSRSSSWGVGKQILQRHLRRWVARFEATLIDACICGLNLKYEWERIKEGGLCIFMVPRPHQNQGSRRHIDEARMLSNEDIMDVMEKGGVDDQWTTLLSLHSLERDDLRKSSGGLADYATVIIIGVNGGLHPLKGDHPPAIFFQGVDVHHSTVMPFDQYCGDWRQDLMNRVQYEHPRSTRQSWCEQDGHILRYAIFHYVRVS
ncbi:hypothetical protein B0H14DRAFT_2564203 [Mycena olivaceomarginata]|nr:hypothetical protein B0H14DRAFT_2564203 [Mycena olivaceomarginata]